jgi:hypothetical protein
MSGYMYMCVNDSNFSCFQNFSIGFWNCSDSLLIVGFFPLYHHSNIKTRKLMSWQKPMKIKEMAWRLHNNMVGIKSGKWNTNLSVFYTEAIILNMLYWYWPTTVTMPLSVEIFWTNEGLILVLTRHPRIYQTV